MSITSTTWTLVIWALADLVIYCIASFGYKNNIRWYDRLPFIGGTLRLLRRMNGS